MTETAKDETTARITDETVVGTRYAFDDENSGDGRVTIEDLADGPLVLDAGDELVIVEVNEAVVDVVCEPDGDTFAILRADWDEHIAPHVKVVTYPGGEPALPAEAPAPPGSCPEAYITAGTPVGMQFLLPEPENTVTFNAWYVGGGLDMTFQSGEPAFEDITAEQWNAEWAPKVLEVRAPDAAAPEPATPAAPADIGPTLAVPMALIGRAQNAKASLDERQGVYDAACESRRQAKDALEAAQNVYNVASEAVINYKTSGFTPGTPMAAAVESQGGRSSVPAEPNDDWRAVTLASLSDPALSDSLLRKLEDNEQSITTLGDLSDWQKAKGIHWAKDIQGIGVKAQGTIDEFQLAHMPSGDAQTEEKAA